MSTTELPYVNSFRDRYGRWHHYYRRDGQRIKLDRKDLIKAYTEVHARFQEQDASLESIKRDTFGALVNTYIYSASFKQLRPATQSSYSRQLAKVNDLWKDVPLAGITRKTLLALRDSFADQPATANTIMSVLRVMLSFAVERQIIPNNPLTEVKKLKIETEGHRPWTEEELAKFSEKSSGVERIAFFLALYTGQRKSDLVKLTWDQIQGNTIQLTQQKTGAPLIIPIFPTLMVELERWRTSQKDLTGPILKALRGGAFTAPQFSNYFQTKREALGIFAPFHGLRKNAAIALVEAGCTPQEAQAITGHATLTMLAHYSKKANQKHLAEVAMAKLQERQDHVKAVP